MDARWHEPPSHRAERVCAPRTAQGGSRTPGEVVEARGENGGREAKGSRYRAPGNDEDREPREP